MSAGELFDLVRPVVVIVSALISTWIFSSARKRFPFHIAILWAGTSLFLPLVVLPIFLVTRLFLDRPPIPSLRGRLILPVLYLSLILMTIAVYEYIDAKSVDSHLARASFAKVKSNPFEAIKHYREALRIEDSPHTHKLLGLSLKDAGFVTEAIEEFRAAERGSEPDETIHYHLGQLLGKSGDEGESAKEYQKFLTSKTCTETNLMCDAARYELEHAAQKSIRH